jgi:hypothetical protein
MDEANPYETYPWPIHYHDVGYPNNELEMNNTMVVGYSNHMIIIIVAECVKSTDRVGLQWYAIITNMCDA